MASRQLEHQKRAKAAGKCVRCGKVRETYASHCDSCQAKVRIKNRKNDQDKVDKMICTSCGKPNTGKYKFRCEACQNRAVSLNKKKCSARRVLETAKRRRRRIYQLRRRPDG